MNLLQHWGALPGPKSGPWLTLGNELSEETHVLAKQETSLGRAPGWIAAGEEAQEDCSAMWLTVLGFMVIGFVSGCSLANHSGSGSFSVA